VVAKFSAENKNPYIGLTYQWGLAEDEFSQRKIIVDVRKSCVSWGISHML
jgi:hypothetical protein